MPAVADPTPAQVLDQIPVLSEDQVCHVLLSRFDESLGTNCGAAYDCVPPPHCSHYKGQELCPDCSRPICEVCAVKGRSSL